MPARLASSLLLAVAFAAPPPATHVVAVSGEVALGTAPTSDFTLFSPAVTAAGPGEFVVAWSSSYTIYHGSQEAGFGGGLTGRKAGLHAQPLTPEFPLVPIHDAWEVASPSLAGNASGRFVVAWDLSDANFTANRSQSSIRLRRFGADTRPLGEEIRLYTARVGLGGPVGNGESLERNPAVAMDPAGRVAVAWEQPFPLLHNLGDLQARIFNSSGEGGTGRFAVTGRTRSERFTATAMDGRGNSIVLYESPRVDPRGIGGLYFRRYDPRGRALGGEVQVAPPAGQTHGKVAASAGGSFVVVWSESPESIRAQRFDATGRPAGPALQVSSGVLPQNELPDVAMDSRGSFVVVWRAVNADFTHRTLLGRVFDSAGTPQGVEIEIPAVEPGGDAPAVALAENGTFLVTWTTFLDEQPRQVSGRAFRALSNRDRCVYRGDTFLCGTASGELTPLIQLGNGVAAGDRPFLADLDGDGADDPCVRRAGDTGAYLCALSGSGYAVTTIPFGAATHVPLLGDVTGDGRAETCVRRGRFFLCDTAHDGGGAELKVPFGLASDLPLLGDVDGDGKADLCVFREGQLFCDTNRDGTRDLIQAEAVQPGDAPLLGDADGDGQADFCVVRGTQLLCDLDRSGALTAQPLAVQPGDVVLLGKVDRL